MGSPLEAEVVSLLHPPKGVFNVLGFKKIVQNIVHCTNCNIVVVPKKHCTKNNAN